MSVAARTLLRGLSVPDDSSYEPVSDTGAKVQSLWKERRNVLRHSANDWWPVVQSALVLIGRECASAGWDGETSVPVLPRTIQKAARVAEELATLVPIGTAVPDIVPESDGDISFSWHVDKDHVFAISVSSDDKINFAGQFGAQGSSHGWQPVRFDSRNVLRSSLGEVARLIARLTASSTAPGSS